VDAIQCLKTRRSNRRYTPEPVPREVLEDVVDCARLAPSGRNVQPWEFVVVTDAETRERLAELATYGKFIAQAPACIVVLCRRGGHDVEDGSAATTNLCNAARAHGLGSCWIAGWNTPYASDVIRLVGGGDELALIALVAVGHVHKDDDPAPPKRPLAEVLHWETL